MAADELMNGWEQRKEHSNIFWLALMRWLGLHLGRSFARALLWPIVLFYCVFDARGRSASRELLRRLVSPADTHWNVLRHFHAFASVLLDRLYLLSDRLHYFRVNTITPEALLQHVAQGRGCVMLMSHFGSFDVMRVLGARQENLRVRVVMNLQHSARFMAMARTLNPQFADDIIDASVGGPALVLQLKAALDAGHIVGMMADRNWGREQTVAVQFLGGTVNLPSSAWLLASALKAPVFLGFGVYQGANRYELHCEKFSDSLDTPRNQRAQAVQAWAQAYAVRLEQHVRAAPYNWFNFYKFWDDESATNH